MRPLILGHRGASGYAPENSMEAFRMAIEMGADGVELDVQLTKDGEIVVIHDETIDRTSNGTGYVKDHTLAQLKALNFNYQNRTDPWNPGKQMLGEVIYPQYEKVEIPTMREVFELFAPTDKIINIELKTSIVLYPIEEKLLELTKEFGMENRVIFSSFNHYSIMKIKELMPEAETGFLYEDGVMDMPAYAKKHGVEGLHPALYLLQYPGFLAECKEKDININVWTVNAPEYMAMCAQAGVHAIITNYPDKAMAIAKQVCGE